MSEITIFRDRAGKHMYALHGIEGRGVTMLQRQVYRAQVLRKNGAIFIFRSIVFGT